MAHDSTIALPRTGKAVPSAKRAPCAPTAPTSTSAPEAHRSLANQALPEEIHELEQATEPAPLRLAPPMPTLEEVLTFVREWTGFRGELSAQSTLQDDLRLYGDDLDELMAEYAQRFRVDLSGYLWYFHTGEEGGPISLGGLFFPPPNARVEEIPITIAMLWEHAHRGVSDCPYPAHDVPTRRYDILVNQIAVVVAVVLVAIFFWSRCTG